MLFAFLIGSAVACFYSGRQAQQLLKIDRLEKPAEIHIKICSDIIRDDRGCSFNAYWQNIKLKAFLRTSASGAVEYGDILTIKNPRLTSLAPATNFGLTNYDDYLKLKNISGKIYFSENQILMQERPRFSFLRSVYRLKNHLVSINKKTLPEGEAKVLNSIIFGTTAAPLSREFQNSYRRVGIIHLLVVSGSQIAILVGVTLSLAGFLHWSKPTTFLISSLFNILFTLATGAEASIMRACVMAEVTLLALLIGREKDIYNALAFSALLLSWNNPLVIFDIGFQLSYTATFALVYLVPVLEQALPKYLPAWLANPLSVCAAPFILTTPLTAFYFNGISTVSLLLNLIIVSWIEILVVIGFLATVTGALLLPLGRMFNLINWVMLVLLDWLVKIFNHWSWSYLNLRQFSVYILLTIYVLLFALAEYFKTRQKKYLQVSAWTLILLLFLAYFSFRDSALRITVFDVGQGESILIQDFGRANVLLDCGCDSQSNDPGQNIVVPTLIKKGIKKLDYVILSHPHFDHYSGLLSVIGAIPVGHFVYKDFGTTVDQRFQELLTRLANKNIKIESPELFEQLNLQPIHLYPVFVPEAAAASNLNEQNPVYLLEYKKFKMLLTGDQDSTGEKLLLKNVSDLDVDVLKVGHHGSRTASAPEFLEQVKPEVSIISVGRQNRYRLPAGETLEHLKTYGEVYRTDQRGAVEIIVNKAGDYKIHPFMNKT